MKATVGLLSGGVMTIDGKNVDASQVKLRDIAVGLGRQCRFFGQLDRHYSVAEHSIHLSRLYPQQDLNIRLAALVHDSAEALGIGDKHFALKAREEKALERAIVKALGFPELPDDTLDRKLGDWEFHKLSPARGYRDSPEPVDIVFRCWGPDHAADMWLEEYHAIQETDRFLTHETLGPFTKPTKLSEVQRRHSRFVERWAIEQKLQKEGLVCLPG